MSVSEKSPITKSTPVTHTNMVSHSHKPSEATLVDGETSIERILKPAPVARVVSHSARPSEVTLIDGESPFLFEKTVAEKASPGLDYHGQVDLEAQTPLPEPKRLAWLRYAIMTIYRRLFSLVFLANVGVFVYVMVSNRKLTALVNAAAANLLACGLARQPLVVNTIFRVVLSVPRSAPYALRKWLSKVYHYGGVHSGCGITALVWYIGFVGLMSQQYWSPSAAIKFSAAPVTVAYIILVLLVTIAVVAHPTFRMKMHDYFELTHRFLGWLVVGLFVVLLMLFAHEISRAENQSLGRFIIELPAFWFLMVTVAAIVHPWLLLRKVAVRAEPLSTHAVRLHFDHTTTTFGKGISLSKHPLRDWHGFATFPDPTPPGENGKPTFSCLISKAGDWTTDTIKNPPTHVYKRGGVDLWLRICHAGLQARGRGHDGVRHRPMSLVLGRRQPTSPTRSLADAGTAQDIWSGGVRPRAPDGCQPDHHGHQPDGTRRHGAHRSAAGPGV